MGIITRLIAKFNSYYADRPVATIMVTNAVLGGIADTVAQTLTAVRVKSSKKSGSMQKDKSLPIQNSPPTHKMMSGTKSFPRSFDLERLTRFMAWGFLISPVQLHWFGFLARVFPLSKASSIAPTLKRMACDQLIFAPIGLSAFFSFMTIAEGAGTRAVPRKLQDTYMPALKANWLVWPLVQTLNFRVVPVQFQVPFVSSVSIAWTAYLSLTNATSKGG